MIYTIEKANLIAEQLQRFTTGYAFHVTGHFTNIDFWFNEAQTALSAIDEHNSRFNNLRDAFTEWEEKHGEIVSEHCPICRGICEFGVIKVSPPKRKWTTELNAARKDLVNSIYYFLTRCYRMGLLNDNELKQKCDLIGTSIDPNDLIVKGNK